MSKATFGLQSSKTEIVLAEGENQYIASYDKVRGEWHCEFVGPDVGAGDIGCVEDRTDAVQLLLWEADIVDEKPNNVYRFEYL